MFMDFCIIRCNSVDGVMKIASVIMCIKILAVITLIICYRVGTCRKPVFDWGMLVYYACIKCPVQRVQEMPCTGFAMNEWASSFLVQMIKPRASCALWAWIGECHLLTQECSMESRECYIENFREQNCEGISNWKFGIVEEFWNLFFDFVFVILIF